MIIPDYNSDKFLYKVRKWGELNHDICLLMYTDHTKKTDDIILPDFSIIIVVREYMEFTQKLNWLEFFGETKEYSITHTNQNSIIKVDYQNGLKVKYVIVESNTEQTKESHENHEILMKKNKNR
ncbi:hypothetical protein [Zobellia alginiliquefaciens]|uniref:hypothetical protein n=1 Tax=Zobellia alginiliquefaciens TaxID=3032586 RepID=UPI0023E3A11D|nr:hypothetical protein [Zobellia alginiliquefaciens]